MFKGLNCGNAQRNNLIPGERCPSLKIPPSCTPMVFCYPYIPGCFPQTHQRFTCNTCECPQPRACCSPPPPCDEPIAKVEPQSQSQCNTQDLCQQVPAAPVSTGQRRLDRPCPCPTFSTGVKCYRIHANPKPTIQPIQIWGCTEHEFE